VTDYDRALAAARAKADQELAHVHPSLLLTG
jgi:hypothetical protein